MEHSMRRRVVANATESLYCQTCNHYFFHSGVDRIAQWAVDALAVAHMVNPTWIFHVDEAKMECERDDAPAT